MRYPEWDSVQDENADFDEAVHEYAFYYTEIFLARFSSITIYSVIMTTIALTITLVSEIQAFGVLLLIVGVIGFLLAVIARFLYGVLSSVRRYWNRYKPPFDDEDFEYVLPISGRVFANKSDDSAVQFILGWLFISLTAWTLIFAILRGQISTALDFLYWLVGLFPKNSVASVLDILSLVAGFELENVVNNRGRIRDIIEIVLYTPIIFLTLLLYWNISHYLEAEFPERTRIASKPIEGNLRGGEHIFRTWITTVDASISGSVEAVNENFRHIIKWILVPMIGFLVYINIYAYVIQHFGRI